jgi:hypothetical protein
VRNMLTPNKELANEDDFNSWLAELAVK